MLLLMLLLVTAGLACNASGAVPPTPFPTVTPTRIPTLSSLETAVPPTTAPAVMSASLTPTQAPFTASPTMPQITATPSPAGIDRIKIFLIAVDDNGKSGDPIGCGDSIIAVERQIAPTRAPLRAALEELLSIHDQFLGESGLLNALYQSELTVRDVAIDQSGRAIIYLDGTLLSGGICDDPRIIAQLTYTARQFSTVTDTAIYINGTLIEDLLSAK
jgi:hypothetical protein